MRIIRQRGASVLVVVAYVCALFLLLAYLLGHGNREPSGCAFEFLADPLLLPSLYRARLPVCEASCRLWAPFFSQTNFDTAFRCQLYGSARRIVPLHGFAGFAERGFALRLVSSVSSIISTLCQPDPNTS